MLPTLEQVQANLDALGQKLAKKFKDNPIAGIVLKPNLQAAQHALNRLHQAVDTLVVSPAVTELQRLEAIGLGIQFVAAHRALINQVGSIPIPVLKKQVEKMKQARIASEQRTKEAKKEIAEAKKETAEAKKEIAEAKKEIAEAKKVLEAERAMRKAGRVEFETLKQQIALLQAQLAGRGLQQPAMTQQQAPHQDTSLVAAGNPTLSFSGNSNGTHNTNAVPTNRISTPAAIAAKIDIQSPQKGIKAF